MVSKGVGRLVNALAFDTAYERAAPVFGENPDRLLADLVTDRRLHGQALDLGAGDGRNSIFLARHGFGVRALELSPTAVRRLNILAFREDLPIMAFVHDVRDPGAFAGPCDLIVADTVLCHLAHREVQVLADEMTEALVPGGWLYASVFARDDPRESEFAPLVQTYFDEADFCGIFGRLEHERCASLHVLDGRHGPPHRHSLLQLVAQRPAHE